jgi:hypothetical protein
MIVWREWRRPRREAAWAVAAFTMFYVIFVGLALSSLGTRSAWAPKAVVVVVGLAYVAISGALAYRVFVHARVVADPTGLTIANPFRGDQHLAWSQIASMRADRLLLIEGTDGRRRVAWVIQKNGWDRARRRRTDADEAIEEMGVLAGRALGTGPRAFAPTTSAPPAAW